MATTALTLTNATLESHKREVRHLVLLMAGHVESMISTAVRALSRRDPDLAQRTIAVDAKVNTAECACDELCRRILSDHELTEYDLRFVTLALKMVVDIERIGDLAVNICERAIDLSRNPPARSYEDIHRIAELVQVMVRDAIDAFVEASVDKARRVIARDDEVDALYDRAFHAILDDMRTDPTSIHCGIHYQSVAKWLERMADHATNVAEQVIFLVDAEDIRHPGRLTAD